MTLSPLHPREAGAVLTVPPPLSAPTRRGPRSQKGRSRGTAVERRSGDPACSNRTGPRVGNGEEGRQGAAENPNTGSPPPPVGPSRHRFLPGISFPAAATGKIRAPPADPQRPDARPRDFPVPGQPFRSSARLLTRTPHSGARSPPGPVPLHKMNVFELVLMRWMNLGSIIHSESKPERERQILYTNTYIWNLER